MNIFKGVEYYGCLLNKKWNPNFAESLASWGLPNCIDFLTSLTVHLFRNLVPWLTHWPLRCFGKNPWLDIGHTLWINSKRYLAHASIPFFSQASRFRKFCARNRNAINFFWTRKLPKSLGFSFPSIRRGWWVRQLMNLPYVSSQFFL